MISNPQHLHIVIISEVRIRREALARILKPDLSVAALRTCTDPDEALSLISNMPANIVLVDWALPNGPAVVARVREVAPIVRVIVFGVREREGDILPWAEAGISGYIPRTARLTQLVPFLLAILGGEQPVAPRMAGQLFRRLASTAGSYAGDSARLALLDLTRREREVADLIAAGLSNEEIARQLNISLATTKSHVHNLLGKLSLRRRSQVAFALSGRRSDQPQ